VSNARRDEVIERVRAACAEGRQAYWVCTLIEESESLEAQAAEAIAQNSSSGCRNCASASCTAASPGDNASGS